MSFLVIYIQVIKIKCNIVQFPIINKTVGISGNMTWNDGQQYYIDAAPAKLTPKEVDSLRQSQTAEMIGTGDRPSGKFSSRIKARGELCKSGRTTGFTKSDRHVQPSMFLSASLYEVNAQNEGLVSVLKRVRLCQRKNLELESNWSLLPLLGTLVKKTQPLYVKVFG